MGAVSGIPQIESQVEIIDRARKHPRVAVTFNCVLTTDGTFEPIPLREGLTASDNPHQRGLYVRVESKGPIPCPFT